MQTCTTSFSFLWCSNPRLHYHRQTLYHQATPPALSLTFSFKPALVLLAAYKPYYPGLTSLSNKGTTGKSRRAGAHSPLSLTAKSKKGGHHTHTHGYPSPNDPRLHLPHHETRAEPESNWPFRRRRLCQDSPAITG